MMIKARMGISADGFVATPDGVPALLAVPGFEPGVSHGYPEFIDGCDAVVMGRHTFTPAVGAPDWPWAGLEVFVLTSGPLPAAAPPGVITGADPAGLAARLRGRPAGGDVHLVGGPQTIRAFLAAGELDRLELVVLPLLLGAGVPLSPAPDGPRPLRLAGPPRTFGDGSTELRYDLAR